MTKDDPRIAAAFDHAQRLGDVDGWEYRASRVVLRRNANGAIELYCARSAWEFDPMGQAVLFAREIERHRAELAEMEALLQALLVQARDPVVALDDEIVEIPTFEIVEDEEPPQQGLSRDTTR